MLARATAIQTMHAVVVWFVSSVLSLRRYPDVGAREGAALTIVESLTLHLPLPAQPYLSALPPSSPSLKLLWSQVLRAQVQILIRWVDAKEIVNPTLIARYVCAGIPYLCLYLSLHQELFTTLLSRYIYSVSRLALYATSASPTRLFLAVQGLVLREQTIAAIARPIIFSTSRRTRRPVP